MSDYVKHILEKSHSFGPIHNTKQILQYNGKGTRLKTIQRHQVSKNSHLNDEQNISLNKIFDALLKTPPAINPQTLRPPPIRKNREFPRIRTTSLPSQHRPYIQIKCNPNRYQHHILDPNKITIV